MRLGTTQARPQWALVGLGLAIVIATYLDFDRCARFGCRSKFPSTLGHE